MPPDGAARREPGARPCCGVGAKALEARIAERAGSAAGALALWGEAVALEDELAYAEPADWFYPLRHYLGAALLDARTAQGGRGGVPRGPRAQPAATAGRSTGSRPALAAQGKKEEAAPTRRQFEEAWKEADVKLARAAF